MQFGIIIVAAAITIEAAIHWYLISKKRQDPKKNRVFSIMRTLVLFCVGVGIAGAANSWAWADIYPTAAWVGYILVVRWAVFDYILNVFRRKPLFYLGDITIDDRIERNIDGTVLLIIKATFYFVSSSLIMML